MGERKEEEVERIHLAVRGRMLLLLLLLLRGERDEEKAAQTIFGGKTNARKG